MPLPRRPPLTERLGRRTGRALLWNALELSGVRIVTLVRTIVLARLLVPDDFGLIAIALVSVEFAISVTTFGIRQALVHRAELEERHYQTGWTFEVVRAVAVAAVIVATAPLIAGELFDEPRAANIIRAIALVPVLDHVSSIKAVDLKRRLAFRPLAAIAIVGAATHAGIAIGLAPSIDVWALVVGLLAGVSIQSALSYWVAPFRPRLVFDRAAAQPLLAYGRGIWVTEVINVLGTAVLSAVIARRLGAEELGVYFLATRLALVPSMTVRGWIGNVAFPVHALLQDEVDRAGSAYRASVSAMWVLLVPVYAVAIALAPGLVDHVLGATWTASVPVIRWLAVAGLVSVVADATVPMLQGRGRTGWIAELYAVRTAVILALAWWLAGLYGESGAAIAWVAGAAAGMLVAMRRARHLLPGALGGLPGRAAAMGAAGGLGAAVAFAVTQAVPGPVGTLGAAVVGVLLALGLLWWFDRLFRFGMAGELAKAFPGFGARLGAPSAG